MSEHLLKAMLGDASLLVGQVARFSASAPVDFEVNNMRLLRSGYVELDTAKFDSSVWPEIRVQPEVVELPFIPVDVADNGNGVLIAITAGQLNTEGRVIRSTDNALTWTDLGAITGATGHFILSRSSIQRGSSVFFIDGFFYIGTKGGAGSTRASLLRSADGINWTVVVNPSSGITGSAATVSMMVKAGSHLFALDSAGFIIRSTDNGLNWNSFRTNSGYTTLMSTTDGRLFAYGSAVFHHTDVTRTTWFERSISVSGHEGWDMAVGILPNTNYEIILVGRVQSALYYARAEWSAAQLDNTAGQGFPNSILAGSLGVGLTAIAIQNIYIDGPRTIFSQGAFLFESTATGRASNFEARAGQLAFGVPSKLALQPSSFIYAIPWSTSSFLGFCRFKNLLPAAGIPFENTANGVTDYVRIS